MKKKCGGSERSYVVGIGEVLVRREGGREEAYHRDSTSHGWQHG